ncbi:MAG: IS982 family transposase [Anaerolineaceae bacterium]|nr:IS982 family transposase [Anaerolineaceae bacterium]
MESLVELFCHVDDFCQVYLPKLEQRLISSGVKKRQRQRSLTVSEVMTLLIRFHQSHYRNFKAYYLEHVSIHLRGEFPGLVSYKRFVDYIPSALIPLCAYLKLCCLGQCTGISFIDSTSLDVCLNQRIASHKVFAGLAARGKTSTGWFFGFKLHLVINDRGELLNIRVTPGNVDDRKPVLKLVRNLFGKLFGDKGYISQPLQELLRQTVGIFFVTKLKSNSKKRLPMTWGDRVYLRRRAIVETVIDQLKNISQIEHSRHRSIPNFMVNLVCGLIAYAHQPKKPSLAYETSFCLAA